MKVIVGLGNPGEKYEKTRHNLGFMVLDRFLKDFKNVSESVWSEKEKFKSRLFEINFRSQKGKEEKIILAKPKTYMNNSGLAVSLLLSYFKLQPFDIWVVHDDIDLPLGSIRIRLGGSSGGHKGVASIIDSIGTEKFWRFRLGIGHPKKIQDSKSKTQNLRKVDDFVLSSFTQKEAGELRKVIKQGSKAIAEALENGLDKAMNKFNAK